MILSKIQNVDIISPKKDSFGWKVRFLPFDGREGMSLISLRVNYNQMLVKVTNNWTRIANLSHQCIPQTRRLNLSWLWSKLDKGTASSLEEFIIDWSLEWQVDDIVQTIHAEQFEGSEALRIRRESATPSQNIVESPNSSAEAKPWVELTQYEIDGGDRLLHKVTIGYSYLSLSHCDFPSSWGIMITPWPYSSYNSLFSFVLVNEYQS